MEDDLDLVGSQVTNGLNAGNGALDPCAASQGGGVTVGKRLVEDNLVLLVDSLGGMHQVLGQDAVICQEQKAFALLVESSDMEEMTSVRGEQVEDGSLGMFVAAGGGVTSRFVQQDGSGSKCMDKSSADTDIVLRVDPGGEIPAIGAVDRDAPLEDQFLTGASGTESRCSQKTIQAQTLFLGCAPGFCGIRSGLRGWMISSDCG